MSRPAKGLGREFDEAWKGGNSHVSVSLVRDGEGGQHLHHLIYDPLSAATSEDSYDRARTHVYTRTSTPAISLPWWI